MLEYTTSTNSAKVVFCSTISSSLNQNRVWDHDFFASKDNLLVCLILLKLTYIDNFGYECSNLVKNRKEEDNFGPTK